MEGYALAAVPDRADVPVHIGKHVSHDAGEAAARTWRETVGERARALADWAAQNNIPAYA